MQNNDKKVLLRISNLKQYFPLKGGRFVKANVAGQCRDSAWW